MPKKRTARCCQSKRPRRISKHVAFNHVSGMLAVDAMRKLMIILQHSKDGRIGKYPVWLLKNIDKI